MASAEVVARWRENRHPPFVDGNLAAVKHGARVSAWRLAERTQEIADEIRPLIVDFEDGDELLLRLLATTLSRIEKASVWVAERDAIVDARGKPLPVLADLGRWEAAAAKYLRELGLTPDARRRARQPSGADALEQYLAGREGAA